MRKEPSHENVPCADTVSPENSDSRTSPFNSTAPKKRAACALFQNEDCPGFHCICEYYKPGFVFELTEEYREFLESNRSFFLRPPVIKAPPFPQDRPKSQTIKYYSKSLSDTSHLYKYDEETKKFYWMDHCWTGHGEWVLRSEPMPDIVEISEERAFEISVGTLYSAPHFDS